MVKSACAGIESTTTGPGIRPRHSTRSASCENRRLSASASRAATSPSSLPTTGGPCCSRGSCSVSHSTRTRKQTRYGPEHHHTLQERLLPTIPKYVELAVRALMAEVREPRAGEGGTGNSNDFTFLGATSEVLEGDPFTVPINLIAAQQAAECQHSRRSRPLS